MIKNVLGSALALLGEAIVAGKYAEGASLPPEPLLGQGLGVSRTVVREAVKSLAAKGLVSTGPKVGTRVLPRSQWNWFDPDVIAWQVRTGLSAEFLQHLLELRRIVEPAAVRLAAERATSDDIAVVEAAYQGMAAALRGEGDYVTHDLRFHLGLLQACRNPLLINMGEALGELLRASFQLSTRRKGGSIESLPLHRAVLDAVIARKPQKAEKFVLELIESADADIQKVLASRKQPPARRLGAARP